MKNSFKLSAIVFALMCSFCSSLFAEETLGCPHVPGTNKLKVNVKFAFTEATSTYSDEVWKAFHNNSEYSQDHDEMVDLPNGWMNNIFKINLGLEYGLTEDLSVRLFIPYAFKNMRRQVWSQNSATTVWKKIVDDGLQDLWLSAKYRVISKEGIWENALLVALGYKPSIASDESVINGISTGTHDFKLAVLCHPEFENGFFICSDIWFMYSTAVREIQGWSKSEMEYGSRFGYRVFFGYSFYNEQFAIIGGPNGWIAGSDENADGSEIADSNKYFHQFALKFRWQPFGDEDSGSFDVGVNIPYLCKSTFAPSVVMFFIARIKFDFNETK